MRIKRLVTTLIFCSLFGLSLFGQNADSIAIRRYYEANAILYWGSNKYTKNNLTYPVKKLNEEFKFSHDATYEFGYYKRDKRNFILFAVVGQGLLISGILTKDRNTKNGLLAGGFLCLTISFPFALSSQKHINRAVWFYNRDIMIR